MVAHDNPLDYIATELELVETRTSHPRPKGVAWDAVQPDQYRDIPFLEELRGRLERR
jgi:5-formyltetrahydrofolate cyclo-ligase